jgi:dienelactone hydrolase
MAEIVVFHHAHGRTPGVLSFGDELRAAGHTVHVPDLFEGALFDDLDSGVANAEAIGFDVIIARGVAAVSELPHDLVYAGFSLGALPAQHLAQTRPGTRRALFYHGGVATTWFSTPWPSGVPSQIHLTAADPWAELDEAESLRGEIGAELFVYPGSAHLFADSGLSDYEPESARLLLGRTLEFLAGLD